MSFCCNPSGSADQPVQENRSCSEKTLPKAALLVTSLLFAGGAVASHFAGIGIPGIVAFSIGTAGAAGFAIALYVRGCLKEAQRNQDEIDHARYIASPAYRKDIRRQNEEKKELERQEKERVEREKKEVAARAKKEQKAKYEKMSNLDLIDVLEPIGTASDEGKLVFKELDKRIERIFFGPSKGEAEAVAKELQPCFDALDEKSEMVVLEFAMIIAFSSKHIPVFVASVLEKVEWPNKEMKQKVLPMCLGELIAGRCMDATFGSIGSIDTDGQGGFFFTTRLTLKTGQILGRAFYTEDSSIPASLFEGIGYAIRICAEGQLENLMNEGDEKQKRFGVVVDFTQRVDCRFPASLVAPLLPLLHKVPGLVGVDLYDSSSPFIQPTGEGGFRDEDADAILEMIKTNPFLTDLKINVNGMSQEKWESFKTELEQILEKRDPKQIPYQFLSLGSICQLIPQLRLFVAPQKKT